MIHVADCSVAPPTIYDFPLQSRDSAKVFICYLEIVDVLSDLCQCLMRNTSLPDAERDRIEGRLKLYIRNVPEDLALYDSSTEAYRPFKPEVAQLHVYLLVATIILHRPRSVYGLRSENVPSITAATMALEILEAFHMRELVNSLPMVFSWHILVVACVLISCSRVPGMEEQSNTALDKLETILVVLGTTRKAATQNLQNIRAIRKAVRDRQVSAVSGRPAEWSPRSKDLELEVECSEPVDSTTELLRWCGPRAMYHFKAQTKIIQRYESRSGVNETAPPITDTTLVAELSSQPQVMDLPGGEHQEAFQLDAAASVSQPGGDEFDQSPFFASYEMPTLVGLGDNQWLGEFVEDLGLGYM
jgi:hypothetical protein